MSVLKMSALKKNKALVALVTGLVLCAVACYEEDVIAIQDGTACGIREDGTGVCWGTGSSYNRTPPAGVQFDQIVAAQDFACGITTSGSTARCWGKFTTAPSGVFHGLAAGRLVVCGIRDNSSISCWGELGYATNIAGEYAGISMTDEAVLCAIKAADATAQCWQLKAGGVPASNPVSGTQFEMISGGGGMCGVRGDNSLYCWGNSLTPATGTDFAEVATGNGFACARRSSGTVTCFGSNSYGQSTPPSGTFLELSAFGQTACGERTDGTVTCWGRAWFGVNTPPAGLVLSH